MTIFDRIKALFARFFKRDIWTAERVEDFPDLYQRQRVYLVGEEIPWSAAFKCPCRCGEVVQLSLIAKDDPSWTAAVGRDGAASLHPSVWRIRGCQSHFFIREGRVIWARDLPSQAKPH
jgi:hypothetical protein